MIRYFTKLSTEVKKISNYKSHSLALGRLLKKLNIDLPYDLAIPLLGIYPKECD
jgi:hypothetical protein